MITLDTFAALLEHGHKLGAWCPGCSREAHADLQQLVAAGLGARKIADCRPVCCICGYRASWIVKPPVPTLDGLQRWGQTRCVT